MSVIFKRKKFDYKETTLNSAAITFIEEADKEPLENLCLKSLSCEKLTTIIICTPRKIYFFFLHNFEFEIDAQELNGIGIDRILDASNSCISCLNDIGDETRKKNLAKKIITSNSKILLIIDESTTLNKKKFFFNRVLSNFYVGQWNELFSKCFFNLFQLQIVPAKGIFGSLHDCLQPYKKTENYLKTCLVLCRMSRPTLGPTQPPSQWVPGALSPGGRAAGP
jgi:hypothetical protein